jgi:small subunit ribosomal protein S4
MARDLTPRCRQCRREGMRLYLKGDRCYSPKCGVERRAYPPGQQTQVRRKVSPYGLQLREKQKIRRTYGVLERPFRRYFATAERRKGVTGELLLQILERRLDNTVYRMGFASSRQQARQLVNHRGLTVNGRVTAVASYEVQPGDEIEVRPANRQSPMIQAAVAGAPGRRLPAWLEVDLQAMRGRVVSLPAREDIDIDVQEQLVVEFYSR